MKSLIILSLSLTALGLCSCSTAPSPMAKYFNMPKMTPSPKELKPGASPETTLAIMGKPTWVETKHPKKGVQNEKPVAVWHYEDKWWGYPDSAIGNWEVYFTCKEGSTDEAELVGYRMTGSSSETGDREVFYHKRRPNDPSTISRKGTH